MSVRVTWLSALAFLLGLAPTVRAQPLDVPAPLLDVADPESLTAPVFPAETPALDAAEPPNQSEPEIQPVLNTVFNPGFDTNNASLANCSSIPGLAKLDPSLLCTLQAMGAKSSVPDGIGTVWYPSQPVQGQKTDLGFTMSQMGMTFPVWSSDGEAIFGNFTFSNLATNGAAFFRRRRRPMPNNLWDIEGGGAYIKELNDQWSWGLILGTGSASDRPFSALRDDVINGSVFVRRRQSEQSAWLFYVVSTTNGQVGHNIPIPGVAYEFRNPNCKGLIGFPFLDVTYKITDYLNFNAYYCAFTDMQARLNFQPIKTVVVYQDFTWLYQSWMLNDRTARRSMLFRYEKHVETGVNWLFRPHVSLNLAGGIAFDRYFVENNGLSLHGPSEFHLEPTPYLSAQFLLQY